ncbi:MAG: hypothetical protein OXG97_21445 [Candidatus Poribacteria bacterium]|nr:hypothetical protein [Candidatus Poribacteria bacterium]
MLAVKDVGDIQGDLSKLVANIQLSDESLYDWCLHFVGAGILGEDADTRSRNERLLGEPERRSDD